MCEFDPTLADDLGEDFQDIVRFNTYVETEVLPIVTGATSSITGSKLELTHNDSNNHLRLIDYFPCAALTGPPVANTRSTTRIPSSSRTAP